MNICKVCGAATANKMYCSNKCKFSDPNWKKSRAKKIFNDPTKHLVCKYCNKVINDVNNLGGHATAHLKNAHQISDIDYLAHYELRDVLKNDVLSCPVCGWSTIDITNKSGQFTTHIKKHGYLDVNDFIIAYPEYSYLWDTFLKKAATVSVDFVECQVCKKRLQKITNTHLKTHDMTMEVYKHKFPLQSNTINSRLHDIHSKSTSKTNLSRTYTYRSIAEHEVEIFLNDNGINTISSYKKLGTEIDIFLPDYNIGIEYDGLKWHSEWFGKKSKMYHLNKTNICNKNDVHLIHIFEDEWIHKKEIVKSKLLNMCGKTPRKIYARNCTISVISNKLSSQFCESNHIQGASKGFIHLGLYYNTELVGVFVVSKLRKALGQTVSDSTFEINRYCTALNTNLIGGFGKCIQYLKNNYSEISSLISYADLRWTNKLRNVYDRSGFILLKTNAPNYWYIQNNRRYHRFNYTKSRIVKLGGYTNLTEEENMMHFGFDRIWDCGTLKYLLKINNSLT